MLPQHLHLEMVKLLKSTMKTRHWRTRRRKRKSLTPTTFPLTNRRRAPHRTEPRYQVQQKLRATTFPVYQRRLGGRNRRRLPKTRSRNVHSSRSVLPSASCTTHPHAQGCALALRPQPLRRSSSPPTQTISRHVRVTTSTLLTDRTVGSCISLGTAIPRASRHQLHPRARGSAGVGHATGHTSHLFWSRIHGARSWFGV